MWDWQLNKHFLLLFQKSQPKEDNVTSGSSLQVSKSALC